MADSTKIEWTDATWNPIRARRFVILDDGSGKERLGWHCEHASPGCKNCYSESMNRWVGTQREYKPVHLEHETRRGDTSGDVTIFLDEKMLLVPMQWTRPRKVFPCSMTDMFANFVTDEMLDKMFAVMAMAWQHTFQILTKRADRMRRYLTDPITPFRVAAAIQELVGPKAVIWPLKNVWCGVSVEDQLRADERLPDLIATLAHRRWVSAEPLLEAIRLVDYLEFIDWVVSGGESGRNARAANPNWFRSLRNQCAANNTMFLHKQNGEFAPVFISRDEFMRPKPEHLGEMFELIGADCVEVVRRVGKKAAGRLLDGNLHDEYPS